MPTFSQQCLFSASLCRRETNVDIAFITFAPYAVKKEQESEFFILFYLVIKMISIIENVHFNYLMIRNDRIYNEYVGCIFRKIFLIKIIRTNQRNDFNNRAIYQEKYFFQLLLKFLTEKIHR